MEQNDAKYIRALAYQTPASQPGYLAEGNDLLSDVPQTEAIKYLMEHPEALGYTYNIATPNNCFVKGKGATFHSNDKWHTVYNKEGAKGGLFD